MEIPKEMLLKLKKSLPHGAITTISKNLNISRTCVYDVFNGKYFNNKVIDEAIKIADKESRERSKYNARIQKLK